MTKKTPNFLGSEKSKVIMEIKATLLCLNRFAVSTNVKIMKREDWKDLCDDVLGDFKDFKDFDELWLQN